MEVSTISYLVFTIGFSEAITTVAYKGSSTVIQCPLQESFIHPSWIGPPYVTDAGTIYTLEGKPGFNPITTRFEYASNSKDLVLSDVRTDDEGRYWCSYTGYGSEVNELQVRIKPSAPEITTMADTDGERVRTTEGRALTVTCTSRGGYPSLTVAWYNGSSAGQLLAQNSTGTKEGDTYTVMLPYTFIPKRQDDRQKLVCRSFWPTPADTQYPLEKHISLYLNLKPLKPSVTQLTSVVSGKNVTVECRARGSRPESTIIWRYKDKTYTPKATVTEDADTQTFTTVSVLRMPVAAADNGQNVLCMVSHMALENNETFSASLDVQFPVERSTTNITGNTNVVANGDNLLILICTTGSSNPPADITWTNGTNGIQNHNGYINRTGANEGMVRSQTLQLTPTRYDHGNRISCSATNGVNQFKDTTTVTLNIYFSPIVTISTPSSITLREQPSSPPIALPCSVDSNPPATITWYHNGRVLTPGRTESSLSYIIKDANRTSYGNYTCTADNNVTRTDSKTYTVEVLFRPLNVAIDKHPGIVTANGQNPLSITCTSETSNPVSEITWNTGIIYTVIPNNTDSPGQYGGRVQTSTIGFNPTRDHDGMTVRCKARNNVTAQQEVSSSTIIDNIIYSPQITALSARDVVEGDSVTLPCHASSKPPANFTWIKGPAVLTYGLGTADYNGLNYTIHNTSRTQNGTYTCTADNKVPSSDSKHTELRVLYPPSIRVSAINTTVNNGGINVTCEASGVPAQYTYERWVHTWNGQVVKHPEPLPNTSVLTLTGLSYAHSGVYTCGASNGVKGISHGAGNLLVKSPPIIVGDVAKTLEMKASGQLMKTTMVTFQYYSNAGRGKVTIQKANGTGEHVGDVQLRDVDIRLPVFLSEINISGTEAAINITVNDMSQFGSYYVIVTNGIMDNVRLSVIIQPLGPPESPVLVNSTILDHQSVAILWISGFPNGLNQTFVIQLSTDNITWWNITQYGGMAYQQTYSKTIDNLASSQLYFVRMLAFNAEGESELTDELTFKTASSSGPPPPSFVGLIAGGASGGFVAAAVISVVIIVVVRRRNAARSQGSTTDKGALAMSSNHNEGYDNGDEEVINQWYESAGPRVTETTVAAYNSEQVAPANVEINYETVNKKSEVVYAMPNKPKELYAVPDKSKDEKKNKERHDRNKPQTGDVYENADGLMSGSKSTSQSDESVYEDTNISAPTIPKFQKTTGTDGLLYADLEFAPRKKGQTKIIGIEDRCEYTTIDLTKKAQPLPDSDDEG